ncbi:MAG: Wzz/FepE/Etk N-terminal domain-containing protein [Clostridia bacterium]|nr:Wzz/FepE/Etk N-terminal domain-containing protein [Clostridia bacterium]
MQKKSFPIFSLLYRNIVLIILSIIIGGLLFGGYSYYKKKPVYTAQKQVVVSGDLDPESIRKTTTDATNSATLAEIWLPTVTQAIKTQEIVNIINQYYSAHSIYAGKTYISGANMGFSYSKNSVILTIFYTDVSPEYAAEKLTQLINSFETVFDEYDKLEQKLFSSGRINIQSVQNSTYIYTTRTLKKDFLTGAIIGLALSIVYVVVRYLFDNKVKSEEEIFELTGEKVIAYLEK